MPKRIVLAFSGGLDTSFCVPWLAERYGAVGGRHPARVDGHGRHRRAAIEARALALGAERHVLIDARARYFDETLRHLIAGNVLRGQVYPLCVGAERSLQARLVAETTREAGAEAVAHGCTAAGNDQVRFEVALRTLAPELEIIAPVRDEGFSRAYEVAFLAERGVEWPAQRAAYSVNSGLWGCTIGGRETADTVAPLPEEAWVLTRGAFANPRAAESHAVSFTAGVPAVNETACD